MDCVRNCRVLACPKPGMIKNARRWCSQKVCSICSLNDCSICGLMINDFTKGGLSTISRYDEKHRNLGLQSWRERLTGYFEDDLGKLDSGHAFCCIQKGFWWWDFDFVGGTGESRASELTHGIIKIGTGQNVKCGDKGVAVATKDPEDMGKIVKCGHEIVATKNPFLTQHHRDHGGRIKVSHTPA